MRSDLGYAAARLFCDVERTGPTHFCSSEDPIMISLRGALCLALVGTAARAAPIGELLSLDVDPGIKPELVRKVFAEHRHDLEQCVLSLESQREGEGAPVEFREPPDADDRVTAEFKIGSDGSVARVERGGIKGLFVAPYCVQEVINAWSFPAPQPAKPVHVKLGYRFRTTAEERRAALAAIASEMHRLCALFTETLAATDELRLEAFHQAAEKAAPTMKTADVRNVTGGLSGAGAENVAVEWRGSAKDLRFTEACPAIDAWAKKHPSPFAE